MKLKALLSALLAAALLLCPMAVMAEDEPVSAEAVDAVVEASQDVCLTDGDADLSEADVQPDFAEAALLEGESGGIVIDAANFPDETFRAYVSSEFDKDSTKGMLSRNEIENAFEIDVNEKGISSLKGVEHFTKLERLYCNDNKLTALDVSANTALFELYCNGNQLTKLDLSANDALFALHCEGNQLTALTLPKSTGLFRVRCSDNQLTALDVSANTGLVVFFCENNQLASLDVTRNAALDFLHCSGNKLTALDISHCSGFLVGQIEEKNYVLEGTVACYEDGVEKGSYVLRVDATVKITGGHPYVEPAPVPVVPTAKGAKATVELGSAVQVDLGGKTGTKYKSSNNKVATVDQNGVVTIKKAGKTKITVKVGKKKRTLTLTIVDPTIPKKVFLDKSGTIKVKKGETMALTASVPEGTDAGGFKWKSSNKKVATVDQNGVVTFKKASKKPVTITVTTARGKKTAKVKFRVTK